MVELRISEGDIDSLLANHSRNCSLVGIPLIDPEGLGLKKLLTTAQFLGSSFEKAPDAGASFL